MKPPSEFIDYLIELFAPCGPVRARAMFGGHGLYADGIMFALVADETLYLKVDEENRADFEAKGLPPFTYQTAKRPTPIVMSYYQAPAEALDDSDTLCEWKAKAMAAARRAAARKSGRR